MVLGIDLRARSGMVLPWIGLLNAAVGLALLLVPVAFAIGGIAALEAVGAGVMLMALGVGYALCAGKGDPRLLRGFSFVIALIGAWLLVAPAILGYSTVAPAFWSALAAGMIGLISGGIGLSFAPSRATMPGPRLSRV
jgi:hypothetical protein